MSKIFPVLSQCYTLPAVTKFWIIISRYLHHSKCDMRHGLHISCAVMQCTLHLMYVSVELKGLEHKSKYEPHALTLILFEFSYIAMGYYLPSFPPARSRSSLL